MCIFDVFFFFKQKTAYEMRISDWSSDVCSSDLETIQAQSKREIMSVLVHLTQSEIRALVRRAAHAKGRYLATLMELPRSLSSRRTAVEELALARQEYEELEKGLEILRQLILDNDIQIGGVR